MLWGEKRGDAAACTKRKREKVPKMGCCCCARTRRGGGGQRGRRYACIGAATADRPPCLLLACLPDAAVRMMISSPPSLTRARLASGNTQDIDKGELRMPQGRVGKGRRSRKKRCYYWFRICCSPSLSFRMALLRCLCVCVLSAREGEGDYAAASSSVAVAAAVH